MLEPTLVIPAQEDTPSIRFYVNPLYSLYHLLIKEIQSAPEEREPAITEAVNLLARVRNLRSVSGIWPISEQPLTMSSTPQEAMQGLKAAMLESVECLGTALEKAQDTFMNTLWPRRLPAIETALATLRENFASRFPTIIRRQGELLEIEWPAQIDVSLVTDCYAWQGGYSHPLTVDIQHNTGLTLCETIIHEATHVGDVHMLAMQKSSFQDRLIGHLLKSGLKYTEAWNVWHAVIFVSSAQQIRTFIDPDHTDYAKVHDLYAWFKVPNLSMLWDKFISGTISEQAFLDEIARQRQEQ